MAAPSVVVTGGEIFAGDPEILNFAAGTCDRVLVFVRWAGTAVDGTASYNGTALTLVDTLAISGEYVRCYERTGVITTTGGITVDSAGGDSPRCLAAISLNGTTARSAITKVDGSAGASANTAQALTATADELVLQYVRGSFFSGTMTPNAGSTALESLFASNLGVHLFSRAGVGGSTSVGGTFDGGAANFLAMTLIVTGSTSSAVNVSVTGQSVTTALGSVAVNTTSGSNATVSPAGLVTTASLGSVTVSANASRTVPVTGQSVTASLGTFTTQVDTTHGPDGLSVTTALGTPTYSSASPANTNVIATGLSATCSLGSITLSIGSSRTASVSGLVALAFLGTPTLTGTNLTSASSATTAYLDRRRPWSPRRRFL